MDNNRTGNGMDAIKEGVKGLVDQGQQKVGEIKNRVVEVKDEAVTRGTQVLDRVTDFIKTNPLKAVGIAFGAGYIGMRIFRK
jgi:ElaB/YqjD/DUF883 family membrane-anchored ribosome-binding protein